MEPTRGFIVDSRFCYSWTFEISSGFLSFIYNSVNQDQRFLSFANWWVLVGFKTFENSRFFASSKLKISKFFETTSLRHFIAKNKILPLIRTPCFNYKKLKTWLQTNRGKKLESLWVVKLGDFKTLSWTIQCGEKNVNYWVIIASPELAKFPLRFPRVEKNR